MRNLELILIAMDSRLDCIKLRAAIKLNEIVEPAPKIIYKNRRYLKKIDCYAQVPGMRSLNFAEQQIIGLGALTGVGGYFN